MRIAYIVEIILENFTLHLLTFDSDCDECHSCNKLQFLVHYATSFVKRIYYMNLLLISYNSMRYDNYSGTTYGAKC